MYEKFIKSFEKVMSEAGCVKINIPADLPTASQVNLWGREHGAMAYFYITYDASQMDWYSFPAVKVYMDKALELVTTRIGTRHTVAFSLFVGAGNDNVSGYINSVEEFELSDKYDLFIGVEESGITHNHLAPMHMDKVKLKIEDALERMRTPAFTPPPPIVTQPPRPAAPQKRQKPKAQQYFGEPVVKTPIFAVMLIIINIAMFAVLEFTGGSTSTMNLLRFGAAHFGLTFHFGEWWRMFTPMFLHIGFMHLMMNTMWLILAGLRGEMYFGHWKFLVIYLVSGVVGSVAMMVLSPYAVGAGASGAIFGLMGALLAYTIFTKRPIENFTTQSLGIMIGINVVLGIFMGGTGGAAISNSAHIGG
ncbi:MAG: rhomboid family intramembrane serine protease, partial [Defluviitaleaceae bacterium]|nr:rhomboid family intramembrane serine protease [Defluviitaleaceae bacterium]